jgi:hypothetical protein
MRLPRKRRVLFSQSRREVQRFKIGEGIVEAGCKQKAAPGRQPPHEKFEHGLLVLATVQIGLDHVEFVEVGGERTGETRHWSDNIMEATLCRARGGGLKQIVTSVL